MAAKFLHIYIRPSEGNSRDDVESKLNKALDWFRYHNHIYIVYSSASVDIWKSRLIDLAKTDGSLLICPLDVNDIRGWMNKEFWEWIRKDRAKK